MRRVSFYKKISLFFTYINIIGRYKIDLSERFNARVDNIYRIYTVLNIPDEVLEEPYDLRPSDIDAISKNFIIDYRNNLSLFLNGVGLLELFRTYDILKVGKQSYLIIIGFSLFDTKKTARNIIISIPIVLSLLSLLYFYLT